MKKKTLGIIIVSVLGAAAIFCSAMFTHQYLDAKNSKAEFDDLTNLITEIDEPQKDTGAEESGLSEEELAAAEAALAREKYAALFAQNNDFIGWIRIDGTNVNYPVMQTPNKPDFYLKRSFDKTYSDYGVPYIDEACMTRDQQQSCDLRPPHERRLHGLPICANTPMPTSAGSIRRLFLTRSPASANMRSLLSSNSIRTAKPSSTTNTR